MIMEATFIIRPVSVIIPMMAAAQADTAVIVIMFLALSSSPCMIFWGPIRVSFLKKLQMTIRIVVIALELKGVRPLTSSIILGTNPV